MREERREARVAQEEAIDVAKKDTVSVFYCAVCDKQYAKVTEYENHLSSYDHHHKKRSRR